MKILLLCSIKKLSDTRRLILACYPHSIIDAFSSVSGALEHIESGRETIDICFVEVMIDNTSGFRFVESVRRLDKRTKVVLIAPDDRFALEGWRYGMNDYLIEPLTLTSIQHTVISCSDETP